MLLYFSEELKLSTRQYLTLQKHFSPDSADFLTRSQTSDTSVQRLFVWKKRRGKNMWKLAGDLWLAPLLSSRIDWPLGSTWLHVAETHRCPKFPLVEKRGVEETHRNPTGALDTTGDDRWHTNHRLYFYQEDMIALRFRRKGLQPSPQERS